MSRYRYRTPQSDARRVAEAHVRECDALVHAYGLDEAVEVARRRHAAAAVNQETERAAHWGAIATSLEGRMRTEAQWYERKTR